MAQTHRYRLILPIAQTISAAFFGGFGLWQRNQILAHTWLNSTARFHVWPWTFKFAAITNTPALLVGLLISWPLSRLAPTSSEYAQTAPTLCLVPMLWYWVGSRLDRPQAFANRTTFRVEKGLAVVALFALLGVLGASLPIGTTGFLLYGMTLWGMSVLYLLRKNSVTAPGEQR
jgi:hypothetical protein